MTIIRICLLIMATYLLIHAVTRRGSLYCNNGILVMENVDINYYLMEGLNRLRCAETLDEYERDMKEQQL